MHINLLLKERFKQFRVKDRTRVISNGLNKILYSRFRCSKNTNPKNVVHNIKQSERAYFLETTLTAL